MRIFPGPTHTRTGEDKYAQNPLIIWRCRRHEYNYNKLQYWRWRDKDKKTNERKLKKNSVKNDLRCHNHMFQLWHSVWERFWSPLLICTNMSLEPTEYVISFDTSIWSYISTTEGLIYFLINKTFAHHWHSVRRYICPEWRQFTESSFKMRLRPESTGLHQYQNSIGCVARRKYKSVL